MQHGVATHPLNIKETVDSAQTLVLQQVGEIEPVGIAAACVRAQAEVLDCIDRRRPRTASIGELPHEGVGAEIAKQSVITGTTPQGVVTGPARQKIVTRGTNKPAARRESVSRTNDDREALYRQRGVAVGLDRIGAHLQCEIRG